MNSDSDWFPVLPADFAALHRMAGTVHTALPERPEVTEEKLTLSPAGCRKLVMNANIVGYGIAHPWRRYSIPPLDAFLKSLPAQPDCLYLHDVVILPVARGSGALGKYVDHLQQLAQEQKLPALALVSVYGTGDLWSRFGFEFADDAALQDKLSSYGSTARYMICTLA